MSRFNVELVEESIDDLKVGKLFYEESAPGIGSYFTDSAMADITSLRLYAGIHSIRFGYHRMLLKRFPFAVGRVRGTSPIFHVFLLHGKWGRVGKNGTILSGISGVEENREYRTNGRDPAGARLLEGNAPMALLKQCHSGVR